MTHPADEIAVRRGDRALAVGEDAAVSAQTRAAGRHGEDRAGIDEDVDQPFRKAVLDDLLRAGTEGEGSEGPGSGSQVREQQSTVVHRHKCVFHCV